MTILTGQLLRTDASQSVAKIVPGYVRLEGELIAEVVEGEIASSADIGDENTFISPGFIDAHLHLPQFDMIGGHGLPLLDWLQDLTFPAERKWEDPDYATAMMQRVTQQLLTVGTTGICAYATVHHQGTMAAIKFASEIGLRGVIGQVLMNREAPDYLCRESNQLIDESARSLELYPPGARMAAAVTPRFAISCTADLLAASGKLAKEHGATVQTHLAETERECAYVEELFDGTRYVDVYNDSGLLTSKSIFGHGIHFSNDDRSALRKSGSTIAHCPTANSFLRSGTMNRQQLNDDGVNIALGSDIGAGYERSMVRVARAMIESASAIGETYPSPAEAWYQLTTGTAKALGWENVGLESGCPADLVVVNPDIEWRNSKVPPLSMLMFAWDDRWINRTFLRGKAFRV